MTINILHLPDRADRYIHIMNQMAIQEADFVLHPGIRHIKTFTGVSRAHKAIIKKAKEDRLPMCCVCEDDTEFSDPLSFKYFIDNIPDDWDLYMGCIYHGEIKPDNTVRDFSSLTLYIIHERFYDKFLSAPENIHLDRALAGLGKFVVCNPFVCKQIDGYSDNSKKETKYNEKYMGRRKFYRSACESL